MDVVTLGAAKAAATASFADRGEAAAVMMSKLNAGMEGACLVVYGDSTGDESNVANRWVRRTAVWLASRYPAYTVNFRQWDIGTPNDLTPVGTWSALGVGKSVVIQTGTGTGNAGGPFVLDVYSASASGSSPAYDLAGARWTAIASSIVPAPDLVIVNHGHNMVGSLGPQCRYLLMKLTRAVASLWPLAGIMVTAQNPMINGFGDYLNDALRARAVITLAATEGYGLINIFQKFLNNPTYSANWISTDGLGIHPSDAGSIVWSSEVTRQLAAASTVVPRGPQTKRDTVWVPANVFTAFATGMTAAPIGPALLGDSGVMWGFPAAQLSSVVADIALPSHWSTFDSYLLWCVASTSGKTPSTVVSWRLLRQTIMLPKTWPLDVGQWPPPVWIDPGVQNRIPSNGVAYQTVVSQISQQSAQTERIQAFRLQRSGNNGTDNIAETAYVRGILFSQAS